MPHPIRPLRDLRGTEWVVGRVAADLLHTTHQDIVRLSHEGRDFVPGKIRRLRRSVQPAHVKPPYMYNVSDLLGIAQRRRLNPRGEVAPEMDATHTWVTAKTAALMLVCSVTTIYKYAEEGHILRRPRTRFVNPVARIATGFYLKDVMAIVVRREAACEPTAYQEETVLRSRIDAHVSTFTRRAA